MMGAIAIVLVVGWLALARPSGQPSARPSTAPSPTSSPAPDAGSPAPVLTIAHVRVRGHAADIQAWSGPAGTLCIQVAGDISCDLPLPPGQAVQVSFANSLLLDSSGYAFGMFVVGTIRSDVTSVRVSLGAGRWVDATILKPPPELLFPFRFFYTEKRTGFQNLNRHLPVVALDGHGRELGRTSYLVQGG